VDEPVTAGAAAASRPAPARRPSGGANQRNQPRKGSGGRNRSSGGKKRR
jgi:hypothetical protein